MKKFYLIIAMCTVCAMASVAQMLPKWSPAPLAAMDGTIKRTPTLQADGDQLVTLPETAVIETDWAIEATYYYSDNIPYVNDNPIWVAFDGADVYFRGVVYTCPTAWIKGKMVNNVASFSSGQFCGSYSGYDVYACGSTDLVNFDSFKFQYDPVEKSFTLANFYLENIFPDQQGFIFYSYRMKVYKDLKVAAPTDLTVVPDVNSAQASWTSDAGKFNLRYREKVDISGNNRFWDFEDEDQVSEFTMVDADGDEKNWTWLNTQVKAHSGNGIMYSMSYDNSVGALTPDNWLITPKVKLGGSVSFWACSQETDANYANEKFQVFVFAGDEWKTVNEFTAASDIYTATTDFQQFTIDLSNYEGYGYIAIRHYDCTDQFWLNIDDIEVLVPDAADVVQPEWIEFSGVTNPYTIKNLQPATEYEVQVCAIEEGVASPWTQSTLFTTLPEAIDEGINEFYLVGSFNGWNWQNYEGRLLLKEMGEAYAVTIDLEADAEFKIITPAVASPGALDTDWIWLGGVDETGAGHFLVTEEYLDSNIALTTPGANFRMQDPGKYTIAIKEAPATFGGIKAPYVLQVKYASTVAVSDINAAKAHDNTWYNVQGMKLKGVPTTPGIYFNAGRKVVIK